MESCAMNDSCGPTHCAFEVKQMEEMRRVSVEDMLRARDERVQRQNLFLHRYAVPLVSFTMNIAGSIKNDAVIRRAFDEGVNRINRQLERRQWNVFDTLQTVDYTGCEALWAVSADCTALKEAMCRIEEADDLGRLFDMDVIAPDGNHLSRGCERSCLICGGPVRACARSRAHSAEELFEKAHQIIQTHFQTQYARRIGEMAQRALLSEAVTTPKPGLVDCENSGAHQDMELFSFVSSACALRPYFEECAWLGMRNEAMEKLQYAGQEAENRMLAAAHANTHKGAIFSLGILCYAAGSCGENAAVETILEKAAELGSWFLQQMKTSACIQTGGERQYHQYGLTGARGEAASGFASVRKIALPVLKEKMESGVHQAALEALLGLMAEVYDSNIIRRAGMQGQHWTMEQAQKQLSAGINTDDLRGMNQRFVEKNISPGGSADLLAVALFLFFLEKQNG